MNVPDLGFAVGVGGPLVSLLPVQVSFHLPGKVTFPDKNSVNSAHGRHGQAYNRSNGIFSSK